MAPLEQLESVLNRSLSETGNLSSFAESSRSVALN